MADATTQDQAARFDQWWRDELARATATVEELRRNAEEVRRRLHEAEAEVAWLAAKPASLASRYAEHMLPAPRAAIDAAAGSGPDPAPVPVIGGAEPAAAAPGAEGWDAPIMTDTDPGPGSPDEDFTAAEAETLADVVVTRDDHWLSVRIAAIAGPQPHRDWTPQDLAALLYDDPEDRVSRSKIETVRRTVTRGMVPPGYMARTGRNTFRATKDIGKALEREKRFHGGNGAAAKSRTTTREALRIAN